MSAPLTGLIDIHACAKYKSDVLGEFGAWHCVIDVNLATRMKYKNIETNGSAVTILRKKLLRGVRIRDIHPDHAKSTYNVLWMMLQQIKKFPPELKHKQPLPEDLSGYMVINSILQEDHNVLYISGEYTAQTLVENKKKQTCLLMRFANFCEEPPDGTILPMLNAIKNKICGTTGNTKRHLKREFFECHRLSGSSGLTCVNNNFFKAIGGKLFLPKKTKACKIVKTENKYIIYYKPLPKSECTTKFAEYKISQPQIGGRTSFDTDLLQKFPWLCDFSASKFAAALLMDFINKTEILDVETDVIEVAHNQISQLHRLLVTGEVKKKERSKMLMTYASRQNVSVVAYPCCFHQDYTGTLPSLENKKCFEVKAWSSRGVGRGGGAKGSFVFALLDWTSHKSGSRRKDFLAATGSDSRKVPRVTEQMWFNHFGYSYDSYRQRDFHPGSSEENKNDE